MKKTSKSNTNRKKNTKNAPTRDWENYLEIFTFLRKPVSDEFLSTLAQDMKVYFIETETALCIEDFFVAIGLNDDQLYRWMARSQDLRESHKFCMMLIGARRETGVMRKKLSEGTWASLPLYSRRWKENIEWKASLSKKDDAKQGDITVVMAPMPTTDVVPAKDKE